MFTGIVEEVGRVLHLDTPSQDLGVGQLSVQAEKVMSDLRLGDSISVNGACLTAVKLDGDSFSVDLALETLRRTNLGSLSIGDGVNLERSLAVSDRLGGHIVQGHVDARGRFTSAKPEGDSVMMGFVPSPQKADAIYRGEGIRSRRRHQLDRYEEESFDFYHIRDTIYTGKHSIKGAVNWGFRQLGG